MNFFRAIAIFFLFFIGTTCFAQQISGADKAGKNDTIPVATTTINGESVPWLPLPVVRIVHSMSPEERAKYNRLKNNIKKVWPYAVFARDRYNKLQQDLAVTSNKREQKRLVKDCDKEIKDMFNREVKNMSITQGHILIKLIDRETGTSTFEMVRELKGGITAFMYQTVARVVGHDLKDEYDPQNEDRDIENIIKEAGYN